MARFDELTHMVSPFAPNVPPFVAATAIRDGARDYFRSVHAHIEEVSIVISAGQDTVIIEPDSNGTEILAITEVQTNDYSKLKKVQSIGVKIDGVPNSYMGVSTGTIRVAPVPKVNTTLIVKLALRPTYSATDIEDELLSSNEDGIRYSALARLKRQPATDWYSPEEVGYYQSLFDQEVGQKRIAIMNGGLSGNITMKIPDFM